MTRKQLTEAQSGILIALAARKAAYISSTIFSVKLYRHNFDWDGEAETIRPGTFTALLPYLKRLRMGNGPFRNIATHYTINAKGRRLVKAIIKKERDANNRTIRSMWSNNIAGKI